MAKVCPGCKNPVTSGQFIKLEPLIYHANCFICAKCKTSCYGKQFAPRGEPGDPNWEIFCMKCDFAGGDWVEIAYQDQRSKENIRSNPTQKPLPKKAREPSPEPTKQDTTPKKVTSVFQKMEEDKLRKERLEQLEKEQRDKAKDTRQIDLERGRIVRQKQQEEDKKQAEEDRLHRQKLAQIDKDRKAAVREREQQYWDDQGQSQPDTAGYRDIPRSAPVEEIEVEETLSYPSPPPQKHHRPPSPPPGPSRVPPPPGPSRVPAPPRGGGPPPPPAGGPPPKPDDVPEITPEKNALLDSIRNFRQAKLRPTDTNDRSAPMIDSRGDNEGGSSVSKPGRVPPGAGRSGNQLQNQLAATLAMRGKY